jgi:4-amino-4-deoxy-L-arabinose transferase-like glycosyltransferase
MPRRLLAVLGLIAVLALGLRVWKLDEVPPGFYIDESSVGANAWSMAVTGHDLYGTDHPVLFRCLNDWKHPLTVYGATASVRVLGPTRFAVRLEAAVFGALAVLCCGLFAFELAREEPTAIAAALVLAVTPWHVHMSRLAWGGPEAFTFPILLALWLWLLARRLRSPRLVALAGAALGLELYTYAPAKLLTPAFLAVVLAVEVADARVQARLRKRVVDHDESMPRPVVLLEPGPPPNLPEPAFTRRHAWLALAAFALVALPMVVVQAQHFDEIQKRFQLLSVWNQSSPIEAAVKSYFEHLSFDFLFLHGDANPRHAVHGWGELLLATAPFCVFGAWRSIRRREVGDLVLLAGVLLYPLGACLTYEGIPHASRALLGAPVFALLAASGLTFVLERAGGRGVRAAVAVVSGALLLGNAGLVLRDYFDPDRYARSSARAWNAGLEDAIHAIEAKRKAGELTRCFIAADTPVTPDAQDITRDDVLFFTGFDPAAFDPTKPIAFYEWLRPTDSVARLLGTRLGKSEVVLARFDREHQLGIAPDAKFLDPAGEHGYAIYSGFKR